MKIDALRQRINDAFGELTRSGRPEVREIAEEVVNGRRRPSEFLHSTAYSEFFHECLSTLENMDPAEREALLNTDGDLTGQPDTGAADTDDRSRDADEDDEDDDFFQRSFLR
ncbi:hypothetical protein SAMN06265360_102125 [Haloechinothrix alba]|uniref:Uncharacterized protein n=1 Tax=Haloechinothrix alba TaxID=664784 RepID=A0A238VDN0_9PSEU|nr:hypothetical protein [Haloechinothrix alba]SNR32520.1 hypothetical protein SAMN06265360_102125 [Haloechinothrix alba]